MNTFESILDTGLDNIITGIGIGMGIMIVVILLAITHILICIVRETIYWIFYDDAAHIKKRRLPLDK